MPTAARAQSPNRRRTRRNLSPRKPARANSGKRLGRSNSGRLSAGSVANSALEMHGGRPGPRPGPRPGSSSSGSVGGLPALQRINSTKSNASSTSTVFHNAVNDQRLMRVQENVVGRWRAKTSTHSQARKRHDLVNSIVSGWTGQPRGNIQAARRRQARNRWKRAITASLPSRAKLTDTVVKFHDFLDAAAKAQGYANLCRMLQAQLSTAMLSYYQKFKEFMVVDQTRYIGAAAIGRKCLAAGGLGIMSLYAAPLAGWVLLKGWDAACNRLEAISTAQRAVRNVVMRSVDGPMTVLWRALGNASAWALPMLFDRFVKDKLREWVSNVSPGLAAAIQPEVITPALRAHRDAIGGFLIGKDVDLLPALVAVSKALDACVVRAVIANFLPHQRLTAECSR